MRDTSTGGISAVVEGWRTVRGTAMAVALSVGGHAVLALSVGPRALVGGRVDAPWPEGAEWVVVEATPNAVTIEEPAAPTTTVVSDTYALVATRRTLPSAARRPTAGSREAVSDGAGALDGAAEGALDGPPEGPPDGPAPRAVPPWVVSPSAVARGDTTGALPGPPSGADVERAMEADITAALRAAARPGHLSERPAPDLRPTRDGGYTWTGTGFSARIEPDGEVTFEDLPRVRYDGPGGPEGSLGVGFRFDVSEALERRHGNDPYYAERAWFLAQTEETRDELARRAASTRDAAQLRRLRGRLVALDDDPALTPEARRRRAFAWWDDFGEDEVGRRAREALEAFVRERWAEGTDAGYSEAELRRLNAGRVSAEPFAPYAD